MPEYNSKVLESTAYRDKETLEWLYWGEELSTYDIADVFDCSYQTVHDWLKKHGIERRDRVEAMRDKCRVERVTHYYNPSGYEVAHGGYHKDNSQVLIHQLVTIAKGADPHDVFSDDTAIHHIDGHPANNSPKNLRLMDTGRHTGHHSRGENAHGSVLTESDVVEIKDLLSNTDLTHAEISERYGVTRSCISSINCGESWYYVHTGG
jgi:predicted DNA-binding protein YlxM (UPF0122 family)